MAVSIPDVAGALNVTPIVADPPAGMGEVGAVVIVKLGLSVEKELIVNGSVPVFCMVNNCSVELVPVVT